MNALDYTKIKVVFMDVGGVLLTNGWDHRSRENAAKIFNFDYDEMNILHNFIYNVFEVGNISLDEYLDTTVFHKERNFSKENFKDFMYEQSSELPELLQWLKTWKQKADLPIFAINNESRELNDFRIKTFNLHQVFDGFFSSCYVGVRKPDPLIFKRALEIVQVRPEECIYFDDRPMLVNAAKKMGINSFHHQDFETTKEIFENLTRK